MPMSQYHLQWGALASLVYLILNAMVPASVRADIPLIRADVDSYQNYVEILLRGGPTRPVRASDWLSLGDAIRTSRAAQVDLRFNDGSLARVGELTTFWFTSNTRNFRLSNGTALLLIPPGNGSSTIETPNVVTGVQGTAVIVRHFPAEVETFTQPPNIQGEFESDAGRTAVMVLTDSLGGPVEIRLRDDRAFDLSAGQIAIVDNGDLYLFEFDLALFYETSPLVEGLFLDNPDTPDGGLPTDPIRQETWKGLSSQQNFVGDFLLNPSFLSPEGDTSTDEGWLFPNNAASTSPAEADSESSIDPAPSSPPHGTSGTSVDLVPPDEGVSIDEELLSPGEDGDENPNIFPPGLIDPNSNEGVPGSEPSAPSQTEQLPPADVERPEINND